MTQLKKSLQAKKNNKAGKVFTLCLLAFASTTLLLVSCTNSKDENLIIWTNDYSVVSYVELFNYTHPYTKAVAVYKESPVRSLPPASDEARPDIVIGSWQKNTSTRKYFKNLDYMFEEGSLNKNSFYSQLVNYGVINNKQYLLPVSFNIPAVVFSSKNEELINTEHFLTLDAIKDISSSYNKKNKSDNYTAMGYGISWDSSFLYLTTKLFGASYSEKGKSFSYNSDSIDYAVNYLLDWTRQLNTNTSNESNFQFKYLYMPKYHQITTDRCLFTYMTSNEFFTLSNEQSSGLSFRWISQDKKSPIEDDVVTMGIYKNAKHVSQAEEFITWFFNENNQKSMLERMNSMNIDSRTFGIAGGFSSIKNVNELVYPTFYRQLLGNVPSESYLEVPNILPMRWPNIKNRVIIPYLTESTNTDIEEEVKELPSRIAEWNRQYF